MWKDAHLHNKSIKQYDDKQLVVLYQKKKSDKAFEEIYLRYKDIMFNYIQKLLYNQPRDIINELLNEVFIKVYLKLNKLKNPHAFKVWLYRIAHNISVNYMKSNKFPYISLDNDENPMLMSITDKRVDIEKNFISQEMKQAAYTQFNELDNKNREIIILKYVNKLTFQEISDITKLSVRTLKNKVKNSIDLINSRLKKEGYL